MHLVLLIAAGLFLGVVAIYLAPIVVVFGLAFVCVGINWITDKFRK